MMELHNMDCSGYLSGLDYKDDRVIFMDPPDNIGLKYHSYNDRIEDYYWWLRGIIHMSMDKAPVVWVSFHSKHLITLLRHINYTGWVPRLIIWRYTFGQYNDKDFGYGFRPILLLRKLNREMFPDNIREESERMRLGDPRSAGLRVPDDVWEYPRVTGNSRERVNWHPTQHPVVLYDRIIRYSFPKNTGEFVDLFAGSGTCFRAGLLNPRINVTGVEVDKYYCDKICEDNRCVTLIQ